VQVSFAQNQRRKMANRVMQSPILKNVKDKLAEQKERILSVSLKRQSSSSSKPTARDAHLLTKEELPLLFENVKSLILHLRARITMEKNSATNGMLSQEEYEKRTRMFEKNGENHNAGKVLTDARMLRTIAETGHKNLLEALNKFPIPTIANVVRLIFQSCDVPLIKAEICAEIFSLQDNASRDKTSVDIDDLRACLGKAPARNIDILGQLVALLAKDTVPPKQLAYSWGVLLFLPRFDHKNAAAKDYDSFDLIRQTQMVISVTQMMIEQSNEVFGLNDEDAIQRLAKEIREMQSMELKSSAVEALKGIKPPPEEQRPKPGKVALKSVKAGILGKCRVTYQFDAEGPLEISVGEGEELYILEKGEDEWWKVRTSDGREGLVPENFVEEIPHNDENVQEQAAEDQEQKEDAEQYYDHPEPQYEETEQESPEKEELQQEHKEHNKFQLPKLFPVRNLPIPIPKKEDFDTSLLQESKQEDEEPDVEDEIAALQKRLSELQSKKGRSMSQDDNSQSHPTAAVATPPVMPSRVGLLKPQVSSIQSRPPAPVLPVRTAASPAITTDSVASFAKQVPNKQTIPPPPLPSRKASVVGIQPTVSAPSPAFTPEKFSSPAKQPIPVKKLSTPLATPPPQPTKSIAAASPNVGRTASGKPAMDLNAVLLARQAKINEMMQQ
jgi:hypothetical protein